MDGFLLATPNGVVRTTGTRIAFDAAAAALSALRAEDTDLIVGALPFDPRRPAALCAPEQACAPPDRGDPPPCPNCRECESSPKCPVPQSMWRG